MKPLVSIIIPIFNAELTLERCLVSIRNQSFRDYEVLMINDGSTDHSHIICEKFQKQDPRFMLINNPNSGVSHSRNVGMELAKGKYVQFVDSDDWLTKDATETFVKTALETDCDMVITGFYRVIGKKVYPKAHIKINEIMSRKEFAEFMMKAPANFYYGVMWNKFFRTDIIHKHQLHCEEDRSWCEDFLFNLEYLQYVQKVASVVTPVYYYVKRKDSIVSSQITIRKTIQMKQQIFAYYKELYQSIDLYEEHKFKIQCFLIASAKDGGRMGCVRPERMNTSVAEKKKSRRVTKHE